MVTPPGAQALKAPQYDRFGQVVNGPRNGDYASATSQSESGQYFNQYGQMTDAPQAPAPAPAQTQNLPSDQGEGVDWNRPGLGSAGGGGGMSAPASGGGGSSMFGGPQAPVEMPQLAQEAPPSTPPSLQALNNLSGGGSNSPTPPGQINAPGSLRQGIGQRMPPSLAALLKPRVY